MTPRRLDPDTACRTRYRRLVSRCRRLGLDPVAVARSTHQLSHANGSHRELDESAFKPTGIALGCPLPDARVGRRLWRAARWVERRLAAQSPHGDAVFAHVPPDWYHITLVNRAHYRMDNVVSPMTPEEVEQARTIVSRHSRGPIAVCIRGLILERSGGLFAPGYPASDDLYELRSHITEEMPLLARYLPVIAHIKLGHVLVPLAGEQLKDFLAWLKTCGDLVSARLIFSDAYSPWGRIEL
ncbi:MAG TPA: hypothetical protein VH988_02330 [Thermoanaerobaculia bacterium]|jgi:hypothetical protein|nr:hypothetical protein [Thermoanaerobaculia bacterium]